jgi:transcriptional regulator with XRE-family HTH domain
MRQALSIDRAIVPYNRHPDLTEESAMPKTTTRATHAFGSRLAALRAAAGFTQQELAAEVGVSGRMIAYYEGQSDHPPTTLLPAIAKALGVTTDTVLGVTPPPKRTKPAAAASIVASSSSSSSAPARSARSSSSSTPSSSARNSNSASAAPSDDLYTQIRTTIPRRIPKSPSMSSCALDLSFIGRCRKRSRSRNSTPLPGRV